MEKMSPLILKRLAPWSLYFPSGSTVHRFHMSSSLNLDGAHIKTFTHCQLMYMRLSNKDEKSRDEKIIQRRLMDKVQGVILSQNPWTVPRMTFLKQHPKLSQCVTVLVNDAAYQHRRITIQLNISQTLPLNIRCSSFSLASIPVCYLSHYTSMTAP